MLAGGCCLALFLARIPLPLSVFLLLSSALPALLIGAVLTMMIGLLAEWNVHQTAESASSQPIADAIGVAGISSTAGRFSIDQPVAGGAAPLGARALLLDEKPVTRELNAACLRQAGRKVLTAESCEEARSKLSSRVDVLLLNPCIQDRTSPAVVEFIQFVRENSPAPKIIFFPSGEADVSTAGAAMRNGQLDHNPGKPSAQVLDITLRALYGGRRSSTVPVA